MKTLIIAIYHGVLPSPIPTVRNTLGALHLSQLSQGLPHLRAWFTFISRTTGLRAVEDFVSGVLYDLLVATLLLLGLPRFPLSVFIVPPFVAVVKHFFKFFSSGHSIVSVCVAVKTRGD